MSNALPSATTSASIVVPFPAGTIISYMGQEQTLRNLAGQGWLVCDGSSFPSNAYPALFAAIGTDYGGSGPNFNVPNLIGCFLRSCDPKGQVDPDAGSRTSRIPGNSTVIGAQVGSRQTEQLKNHQHFWDRNFGQITHSGSNLNVQLCDGGDNAPNQGRQATTNVDGGGNETRPINVYAWFLIFAGLPQTA